MMSIRSKTMMGIGIVLVVVIGPVLGVMLPSGVPMDEVHDVAKERDIRVVVITTTEKIKLVDFPGIVEFARFMRNSNVSSGCWAKNHTCLDISRELVDEAAVKGYRLYFVYDEDPQRPHMVVMAWCVREQCWVGVEPQNDQLLWIWHKEDMGEWAEGYMWEMEEEYNNGS